MGLTDKMFHVDEILRELFRGGLVSGSLIIGVYVLKGLFQSKLLSDSMIYCESDSDPLFLTPLWKWFAWRKINSKCCLS